MTGTGFKAIPYNSTIRALVGRSVAAILNAILSCIQHVLMSPEYGREALPRMNCLVVCPLADYSDIIKS
jgi:hypothetical protein